MWISDFWKKLFSNDEVVIRIKKSSLSGFVLGFVFAAPIFIGASWLIGSGQAKTTNEPSLAKTQEQKVDEAQPVNLEVKDNDYVLGNKNAKVILVLFTDLQCPYCARHHKTIKALAEKYGNKIGIVFRHFPLSFHEFARTAANAAECAGEQGKFFEFVNKAFDNQANYSNDFWQKLAKDLGINVSKFNKCLTDKKYDNKIDADMEEGSQAGVDGTPATFINGKLISGAQPVEVFENEIDKLLK